MAVIRAHSVRINEGIRVNEAPLCLLCSNEGLPLYQGLRDRLFSAPGTWALMRCPKCGLVWLNPRPVPQDIGKLYEYYYTHDTADHIPRFARKSAERIASILLDALDGKLEREEGMTARRR